MMLDQELQLNEYLGRTTVDAAAAGLQLMDYITGLNQGISWRLHRGRIDFTAERPFCSLQPQATGITCRLHDGRQRVQLTGLPDISPNLRAMIRQAYQHAGG